MVVRPIEENFAPYASANSVVGVIRQLRNRGLPEPVTGTALEAVGVPQSMTAFTLRALVFLGLIEEGGNLTPVFAQMRRATTEEYPGALAEVVRRAYQKVFSIADPSADDEVKINDAFRVFEPANQRNKMVRLFMGLCEEARIVPEGSTRQRRAQGVATTTRPARRERNPSNKLPPSPPPSETKLNPLLGAMIKQLETLGPSWAKAERNKWLEIFTVNLDYTYPPKDVNKEGT